MTTHEQQNQGVVLFVGVAGFRRRHDQVVGWRLHQDHRFAAAPGLFVAKLIGDAAARDLNQPGPRVVGEPFARPLGGRGQQRLLDRILRG